MNKQTKRKKSIYIKQSNYITSARYNYTAQEKRILYRIVEEAYKFRSEYPESFTNGICNIREHKQFVMPISHFMNQKQLKNKSGKAYDEVVEAFSSLVNKRISFKGQNEFSFGGILNYADRLKNEGQISFMVHRFVWQSALDYTTGFTKIELETTMQFKSAYSMRFYEISREYNETKIWNISVLEFRELFGCIEKYTAFKDLEKYIICTAKKELDETSPISFKYEKIKNGKKISRLVFSFYETNNKINIEDEVDKLIESYSTNILSIEIKNWLKYKLSLTTKQIKSNLKLFAEFERVFRNKTIEELEETYQWIHTQYNRPQENIGLFIQNLKMKLNNATGL